MATLVQRDPGLPLGGILKPGRLLWLRILAWMMALFLLVTIASGLAYAGVVKIWGRGDGPAMGAGLGVALVSFLLYRLLVPVAERRKPAEVAGRRAARETAIGLAIGAAMMAAIVAILTATGLYSVHFGTPGTAWDEAGMAIRSGVSEEIIFRAILLRLLWRAFGPVSAFAVSAALFGALHLGNPNATWFAALCIAIEAGIMLGAFYALTRRIWVSIGIHAGWNFTQGWVFGAAVSGLTEKGTWGVSVPDAGAPAFLSGAAFGPEASLPGLAVGTLVGGAAMWIAWRRGRLGRIPG